MKLVLRKIPESLGLSWMHDTKIGQIWFWQKFQTVTTFVLVVRI